MLLQFTIIKYGILHLIKVKIKDPEKARAANYPEYPIIKSIIYEWIKNKATREEPVKTAILK